MVYRSGLLALLLALSLALISATVFSVFGGGGASGLVLSFFVSFAAGWVVIFLVLEFLFFREIAQLEKLLTRLIRKDSVAARAVNPLGVIRSEVESFAESKQKEIDGLKKLEAFRKEFIADISHELKTPIFAAQGFLHTLIDGAVNDKAVRGKFLKKAAKSLDGLDVLVQDLLTLSQIETGQIKMQIEHIDLYTLTRDVFEQFEAKVDKKEIGLRIEGKLRKVMVYADRQRIAQVLTNLISNAIKHSDAGSEVVVSFSLTKKSVITQVTDYGEGIAEEHIQRIFERFYRVDKSRSREKGGTGLGLAIVKHILDGHGSKPKVHSNPGKGATFSFKLPRFRKEAAPAGLEQQESKEA